MKKTLSILWKIIKNKYVAATLVFLLFFLFLGENNILVTRRLHQEVAGLDRECNLLKNAITQDSIDAEALLSNPDALEAYGREHYYMKRPDEDIFVVISD